MNLTINELKAELIDMFQKAYQQGVRDCRKSMKLEYSLPMVLKREHVAKLFQVELPT